MAVLPVANDAVQLSTAGVATSDTFANGVLVSESGLARAVASTVGVYTNGLLLTDAGRLCYVDATAALPADTVWLNGLPRSNGALCVSTDAALTYSNGIPLVANGAVAAGITV